MRGLGIRDANGQDIAWRAVQDACGLRAKEQCDAVSPVGSHDDHIHFAFFCRLMDLCLRSAKHELLAIFVNIEVLGELGQVSGGLIMNLILHGGEVHGDFTAVGQAEWLDHVNYVKFRAERISNAPCSTRNMS